MSDEFRKNLMGPEPTLLPAETEIYQHLALGQEAVDLVAKHPTSSLLWAVLAEGEVLVDLGLGRQERRLRTHQVLAELVRHA